MTDHTAPVSAEDLLAQARWVHALARALLGDATLAEDVTQEAYVKALAQPPQRLRSLRGWLGALVANLARSEARSRARRARREQIAALSEALPSTETIVEQEAVRREVVERVLALQEPYRTVVLLRFWGDLEPSAIGRRLDVPASTVRTQLQRALAQLSRDLDREHGGDRRAWIQALAPLAGTSEATVGGAALALGGVAAAVVIGMVAAVAWWPRAATPVPSAPPAPTVATAQAPPASPQPASLTRAPLAASLSPTPPASLAPAPQPGASAPAGAELARDVHHGEEAVVRGRCVAAETGEPLAGCRVQFDGKAANRELAALEDPVAWSNPEPIVTGADGGFEVRCVPPPGYVFDLEIEHDGRAPRRASWSNRAPHSELWSSEALAAGNVEDLGDVPLAIGHTVRGRVVDEAGHAVPRVPVTVRELPLPVQRQAQRQHTGRANDSRRGLSGDDGTFSVSVPLPAGTWPLDLETSEYELVEPKTVTVSEAPAELRIVVKASRMLKGIVVDENDAPIGNVQLETRVSHRTAGRIESAHTRADGSFRIHARPDAPERVQLGTLETMADDNPCEPFTDERLFAWGTTDIRLIARRRKALELTVMDALTGAPIEEYAVQCGPVQDGTSWRTMEVRLSGQHPKGCVLVDQVRRGRNVLRVIPKDRALGLSDDVPFTMDDGPVSPLRVLVVRPTPVRVRVVGADGSPVAGIDLELLRARGAEPDSWDSAEDPFSDVHIAIGTSSTPIHVPLVVSRATTSDDGLATVYAPAAPDLVLVASGARPRTIVREHFAPPNDGSVVEVRIDAAPPRARTRARR